MSLYQCEECGGRENTACGSYHGQKVKLCSECKTGKWHGQFPKLLLPKGEFKTNREGNLAHIKTGSIDLKKYELIA